MRLEGWETQINSEPIMQIERTEANHAVSHRSQNSWDLARANYRNTKEDRYCHWQRFCFE
jgi:hypothetical protein